MRTIVTAIVLVAAIAGAIAAPARAQEKDLGKYSDFTPFQEKWLTTEPRQPTRDWLVSYGGRLYDTWYALVSSGTPSATHPSYPKTGKQKGPDTWRCKACHGWDYRGKDGAYGDSKSSNYTGIKGIREAAGRDPLEIVNILRDDTHKYTQRMLPQYAAERIALFVSEGQHDATQWIGGDGKVKGNAQKGAAVFQNLCAVCHGFEGKSINFGSPTSPEFLGTAAEENAWELLHKIRNGHPGAIMPSQRWVPMETIADIAAYAQTLPMQ